MFKANLKTASRRLQSLSSQVVAPGVSNTRTMATRSTILKLNTGADFPAIGFGTWQDKEEQEKAVLEALKLGYRHVDTARM